MATRMLNGKFLVLGIALACYFMTCTVEAQEATSVSSSASRQQMRLLRKNAAKRRRRIIFNNDGDDVAMHCKEATPAALLRVRTTGLLNTQVDTIIYNTAYCFGNFLHRTKIGTPFTNQEGWHVNNKVGAFLEQGTDSLEIVVDYCRKNDMEIFWSMRMNDIHDGQPSPEAARMFPQFKKDHPELLMGSKKNQPKIDYWTSVDYSHQKIRDMSFLFIQEVCENYDVDGIELDFFRHMPYFKSVAMRQDATQDDLDKMTRLLRRVRQMADRVGRKRGRPILIAVRVPDSVDYCRASGFDIVRWMKEDLIDLLMVSGYFRLNPWETSVKLGHKYGVPVYPCLSDVRRRDVQAATLRRTVECLRGRAAEALDSGADGVYLFNLWDIGSPVWNEIGTPRTLATVEKVYTTGARTQSAANRFLAGGSRFIKRATLSPAKPRKLKPGQSENVTLRVAENFQEAKRQGRVPSYKLMLRFNKQPQVRDISVQLNNELLTGVSKSGDWIKTLKPLSGIIPPTLNANSSVWVEYAVTPKFLRQGANAISVTLKAEGQTELVLEDLLLRSVTK